MNLASIALDIYIQLLQNALPIAVIFGIGNLLCNIILTAAFTGKLDLSGRGRYL